MSVDVEALRAQRAASPESQAGKLARAIYPGVLKPFARSFFNRDNLFERKLQASILREQPIQIVGFWGVGGKQQPDKYDELLLSEYEAIRDGISRLYPQAADMMLIFADIHGRFNGYQDFEGYHEVIAQNAHQKRIVSVSLDDLYREWNIALPDINFPIDKKSQDWKEFSESRRREQLIESALKHSRKGVDSEQAAFYYWIMRRQEREPLSQSFPNAILLINGSEDLGRITLPLDMPHIYSKVGPVWFQHE